MGVDSVIISVRIIVLRIMVVGALVLIAEVVEVGTDFTESVKNNKKKYTSLYLSLYLVLLPSVPSFISLLSSRILTFKTANTMHTCNNTNTDTTNVTLTLTLTLRTRFTGDKLAILLRFKFTLGAPRLACL